MRRGDQVFAICDTEKEYAFRFMEYISRKQNLMFEIRAFTSAQQLIRYAHEHPIEILLISERSMCDAVAQLDVGKLVILTEDAQSPAGSDFLCVYKYQSSDAVVREIMEEYGSARAEAGVSCAAARRMETYGVFAPAPYPEQMLFSLALGMALGEKKRVLYLNLEAFSGLERLAGFDGSHSLGDLLYLFRQSGAGAIAQMNGIIRRVGTLDCMPPVRTPSDFMEVTGEEWIRLFEGMAAESRYDALVLDIGGCIPDAVLLLAYCRKVFLPGGADALSQDRVREFRTLLDQTENGTLARRMEVVHPPAAVLRAGEGAEQIRWSKLGAYARDLCGAGGA